MFNRRIITRATIIMIVTGFIIAGTIREVRVRARPMPTAVERQPLFGMVGITGGQTLRLNVANLERPGAGAIPPGPCRAVLTFRDDAGLPFTDSNGEVIRREVDLQPGQSAFLDLNADLFGPPSTNGAVTPARLQLRPFVRVLNAPGDPDVPPGPCFPTMEVFDNATGRSSLFSAGFEPPGDPDSQP